MIKIDTFGPDDIQIGDIIRSRNFEWKVVSLNGGREFPTLHRPTGSDEEFSVYMRWQGNEFLGPSYTLFRPYKEVPYDPSQQGDREDDI